LKQCATGKAEEQAYKQRFDQNIRPSIDAFLLAVSPLVVAASNPQIAASCEPISIKVRDRIQFSASGLCLKQPSKQFYGALEPVLKL